MNEATPAVKTLTIDGVPPNRTSILTDRFKYSRPFFLALNGEPQDATKAFIDFCTGAKGQKLLSDHGLLQVY
jgi:phosphate transport system substrate-binding protein